MRGSSPKFGTIDFASKAFGGSAQESIASLKSTRDALISVLNQLTEPLAAFKSNNTAFDNSLQTFAVIPNKIKNQISLLPEYLKKSIASGIPQVSKELVENQANHYELMQKSFEKSIESFKEKTNNIISEFNKEISYYKQELIKPIMIRLLTPGSDSIIYKVTPLPSASNSIQ